MKDVFPPSFTDLNTLFNQAPVAMAYLKGLELVVEAANFSMLELWGKNAEIIGKPVLEALPEIIDQPFPLLLRTVYSSGEEHYGNETEALLVRNGVPETCYFNFVYSPIKDFQGTITGVSVIASEVTEQVKAKKKLEESEHRFRSLVLDAEVSTAIYIGERMIIELANEKMLETWGKDKSVIGKPLREALPELEDQPFHDLLARVYRTGITYRATEDRVDLAVGGRLQTFYYNFSYKALRNEQGEIYGILNMAVNVTEQVSAKRRTEESEAKLRDTILQAPVAMAILKGPEFIVETANHHSLEIWGKDEQVIGKTIKESFPELDGQGILEILDDVYNTGIPFYGNELEVLLQHGNELRSKYINFVYHPLFENGRVSSIMSLGYEVTDQVLGRKKAEESEARFRSLVNDAPVATAVLRGENMVLELVNDAMLSIWGKDRSILGEELLDFLPELKKQSFPQLLADVYHSGKEYSNNESRAEIIVNGSPKTYYLNFTYKPLRDNNKSIGILVMCIDVTEQVLSRKQLERSEIALKASENRLQELADSMPQIVWTAGPDGYLDYFNQQWYDYTGFREKEFNVDTWTPILHPDDLPRVISTWRESVNTGKPFETEYQLKDRNNGNQYRWFLGRATAIKDDDENIIRWIGTNTDIHEYKMLQRQKDNFLGIASHELKTPVTSIKAYTQILEAMLRKNDDDKKADLVQRMDMQINRLTSLIGDLLDVTKIRTGRIQFNDDYFDFNELVKEIVEELQPTSLKHTIITQISNAGVVFADKHRIGQVITNLITNAVKYSPHADKIVVRSGLEGQHVQLCVQDFGIGIPDDKKDKVFEQFYRVSGDKQHTFPGLGLGLYISSEIVKREGGEIWVTSVEDEGSTFCFSLPVNRLSSKD